jgi:ribosomal protein S18 acetylase RimI-like enzyme
VITQRGLRTDDRPALVALLASVDAFTDDEREVALELVDNRLARPEVDEYRFILSAAQDEGQEKLAGYICYGRTPMTQSTYDLYWLATSPSFARMGIARGLVAAMEEEIAREGGGLIRVETGSREGHTAAAHFYDALGFERTAVLDDFYAPDDDLIIFTKRVKTERDVSFHEMDEAGLYDAAFGYRDYGAERDFLLACAREFGEREVKRVLAWACGPARHLFAFADVGIAGIGADAGKAMVAYARRIAGPRRSGSAEVTFVRADLDEKPKVPRASLPVDLSFVALSGIHQLGNAKDIEKHLKLAASLLAPGGVHVIEATHPSDLTAAGVSHTEWTEMVGDKVIDARFRMHVERMSPERVVPVSLEVSYAVKGAPAATAQKPQPSLRQDGEWFIPDLAGWRAIVGAVPDFTLAAALGDFNVEVPFEHQSAWRLILVLKRV